jgi:palmitoyltransferase
MPRPSRNYDDKNAFTYRQDYDDGDIVAFRLRQQEDLKRFNQNESAIRKRQQFHRRYEAGNQNGQALENDLKPGEEGEESWRNSEGDRLADYGVDEDVEFYDEENIPLAELIQRRKVSGKLATQGVGTTVQDHHHATGSTQHQHAL